MTSSKEIRIGKDFIGEDGKDYSHLWSPETHELLQLLRGTSKKAEKVEKKKPVITSNETACRHLLATPRVEVRSISICPLNDKRPELCQIYGHIRVIDTRDGGSTFYLFQKDEDCPESIKLGETLFLTSTTADHVIVPSKYIKLDVLLYDKNANDAVIAEDEIAFDQTSGGCEEDHSKEVYGKDKEAFARLHYTLFQYAVTATVDVLYFSQDDTFDLLNDDSSCFVSSNEEKRDRVDVINYDRKDCGDGFVANLCGSVTARSMVDNGNGEDNDSISLFTRSPENGVHVKSGGFIQLSKSVVVVPAYSSSLRIDVNLSHCDNLESIGNEILEFKTQDEYTFKKDLTSEQGRVRVRVTWGSTYDLKTYQASDNKKNRQKLKGEEEWGSPLIQRLEVFSVAVHSFDFKPFSFYGAIGVMDWKKFLVFLKDESCPQVCRKSSSLATLKCPFERSVIALDHFSLRVDLKDATTGAQISNGYAPWDNRLITPLLDQRLCSVIRGERGFAAVHYTAVEDAITALVDIKLDDNVSPEYVYGKIVARYSTYDYSTAYDKEHYQSILFDRHSENCESQEAQAIGSSLPLLKSIVCLPRNSSLIIEADLTISADPPSEYGKLLHGCLELKPSGESHGRLGGEASYMDVSVKWSSEVMSF